MPTIRVDYHEKNRLALITDPVRKSVEQIRALHPEVLIFIRTGWLNGPHLELCVASEGEIDLSPQLQLIRNWVKEHPSTTQLKADEYEMLSRKVGALEGIPGPYLPLRPDNTAELVDYHRPRLVDGHEALQKSYIRFFDRSAPILFRLAALKSSDVSLATIVQAAMLARAAGQYEPEGLASGYLSLQAHADFFFANFDREGRFRRQYDRLAEAWSEQLELAVQGSPQLAADSSEAAAQVVEIMKIWEWVLADAKAEIQRVIRIDKSWFDYNPTAFPDEMGEEHKDAFASAGLPMRKIEKGVTLNGMLGSIDTAFFRSDNFQTFRVILNMYYSFLRTLNVSPAERFGLCYLVATTFCRMRDSGTLDAVNERVQTEDVLHSQVVAVHSNANKEA
jgi:hypothetical protein